jgi:hypothetical protein
VFVLVSHSLMGVNLVAKTDDIVALYKSLSAELLIDVNALHVLEIPTWNPLDETHFYLIQFEKFTIYLGYIIVRP